MDQSPIIAHRPRGMVLVLVLVAIALLSLAGFTFAELMYAEREGAWVQGRRMQSRALANSGVEMAKAYAVLDEVSLKELGGLYDNPDRFRGMLVRDDPAARDRGRFTVMALAVQDGIPGGVRFGLEDESNRLNLNVLAELEKQKAGAGKQLLMSLPGMTEETADAILDWLDADDEQRQYGAEADYYSSLSPSYAPRNGPLTSVEELLLVRDVTPALLFGADTNRNGVLDANESAGQAIEGVDNSDGSMNLGWSAYLTIYSAEFNLRADGTPKIDLNADDVQQLHADLSEAFSADWATYICAYRQSGPTTIQQGQVATAVGGRELDLTKTGSTKLTSVLDLIGGGVQATFRGTSEPVLVASPFSAELAVDERLLDRSHGRRDRRHGRGDSRADQREPGAGGAFTGHPRTERGHRRADHRRARARARRRPPGAAAPHLALVRGPGDAGRNEADLAAGQRGRTGISGAGCRLFRAIRSGHSLGSGHRRYQVAGPRITLERYDASGSRALGGDAGDLGSGWHALRNEGRGTSIGHALRSSGRATRSLS